MNPPLTHDELEAALAKDILAIREREATRRQVATDPLPGPAARAWAGEPVRVHGFTIRPCLGGDVILLKRLDSPLIRRTKELVEHFRKVADGELPEDAALPNSEYSDEEAVEMIFQFLVPIDDARRMVNQGRGYYREAALRYVADELPYPVIPELMDAVEQNYRASFDTFVRFAARTKEGEESRNFSMPPAKAVMASAGGSTITAS
jgi:hypothetical protein